MQEKIEKKRKEKMQEKSTMQEKQERQLHDEQYYAKLTQDPANAFKRDLKMLVQSFIEVDQDQILKLISEDPQPGKFYLLPKIHKPNNPGRPIVSNKLTLTEKISHYVEFHLKPYAQKANSFIQDTTDFLNKLKNVSNLPNNTMLVTLDVCSLYTNISHSNGLSALKNKLPNNQTTSIILQLTQFILEHNHFKFQDEHYLQTKGTAMGTPMAPQYANIFMAHLEERILKKSTQKPILYLRYIDDIFMLWTHGEKALNIFCSQFNLTDPNIQLTINFALDEINFLDTIIKIKDNKLVTTLYQKPTHKYNYVHPKSSHPPHIFKSIIFSQALRYNRICSDNKDRDSNYIQLKYNFQKLGYDTESINKQINRARSIPRDSLLQYKLKSPKKRTPLVLTYHPQIRFVAYIAKKLQPILKSDPLLQHLFPVPPLIAYRQPPNFKRILTSNKNPQPHPGTFPCNTPRCQLCVHIRTDNIVTGPNNYKFTIRERFTCTSSNVVYLLSCLLCPKAIYIGETGNTIRKRINGHKSDIRNNKNKPVAKHFNLPEHSVSHLQVSILKRTNTNRRQRQIEEQKLISKFNCIQEGLNKDSGFLSHYLKKL